MFGIENFKVNKDQIHQVKLYTVIIIRCVLSIIALYLSWNCGKNSSGVMRGLGSAVSALFPEIYIPYYAVYRVFMGNKCY